MEKFIGICSSPWCKAHFEYTELDLVVSGDTTIHPKTCHKCVSFDSDMSGGVSWVDKEYEGSRFDGTPHQIKYKVTNFKL